MSNQTTFMNSMESGVTGIAGQLFGKHAVFALAAIAVVVTILAMWLWRNKEMFNPTALAMMQAQDTIGIGRPEFMEPGRAGSAFAQQTQFTGGIPLVASDPTAKANQPGSLGWQVLHSSGFDCNKSTGSNDDAWAWQSGIAHESFTDNQYSKIAAGLA